MRYQNQTLLIDADDTLWQTNVQFERVAGAFTDLVAPLGCPPARVRETVDRVEQQNIRVRGYGMKSFLRSLEEAFVLLAGRQPQDHELNEIRGMERHFQQPDLLAGVAETLEYLSGRHHLHLFSKGNRDEQVEKFNGSGLQDHFDGWDIVPEKDAGAYREVIARHGWDASKVWMVGNSPRSDINPALAIGLNAVFIPAAITWEYEDEQIRPGTGELLRLEKFSDLREHF